MRWVQLGAYLVLGNLCSKRAFWALATSADGTLCIESSLPLPKAETKYNGYDARQRPGKSAASLYEGWKRAPPENTIWRLSWNMGDVIRAMLPEEISNALNSESRASL